MNAKTKEILIDLAHLVHQAILTDDDLIAQQALVDVYYALASVLPMDFGIENAATAHSSLLDANSRIREAIAREVAATVARQIDEDDLAQQLENA